MLLGLNPARVLIIDNLLSAERCNVPDHPAVQFTEASITDDRVLGVLQDEWDYVFLWRPTTATRVRSTIRWRIKRNNR
jgi:hypothetical protein